MHTDIPAITEFKPEVKTFFNRIDIAGPLEFLRKCLPAGAKLFVAGGAIRNLLIRATHGSSPATRDIDLFVGDVDADVSLDCSLAGQKTKLTELDGIRWQPESSDLAFDICRLSDFVIIKKYQLAPTLENLLQTLDFTVNAVVFDFNSQQLYEKDCLKAICTRRLEFNTTRRLNNLLLAYRILLIRFKTGFILADRLFAFLKYRLDLDTIKPLRGLMTGKQGREMAHAIMDDYNRICSYADYQDYLRKAPETA